MASSAQIGYISKLEHVLVGSPSESFSIPLREDEDDTSPDHPWNLHYWLVVACQSLFFDEAAPKVFDSTSEVRSVSSGYNLLAPPPRAPPIA